MSRKKPRGYYVRGAFIATGSDEDVALQREDAAALPSKTALKARSSALQKLGVRLAALPPDAVGTLELPTRLVDAIEQLGRIHDFEGARRQRQFIGKLMRKLTDAEVAAVAESLERAEAGGAADTLLLHAAEDWRERLVASDDAVTGWVQQFPGCDVQRLRTLVRQARADAAARNPAQQGQPAGAAPRRGRAWRALHHLVRDAIAAANTPATEKSP